MGWTAAQKDANPQRGAEIRALDAKRARERRAVQRAARRAADPTFKFERGTKVEIAQRREAIRKIVAEMHPMNVRSMFYQAVIAALVDKETGYPAIDRDLILMRRAGAVPYGWITDGTRRRRTRYTCSGVAAALEDTRDQYRKALWNDKCSLGRCRRMRASTDGPMASARLTPTRPSAMMH